MTQHALPLIVPTASRPTSPALDTATVQALAARDVVYRYTRWNAWFAQWEHCLIVRTPSSRHEVRKTDAGVAAILGGA